MTSLKNERERGKIYNELGDDEEEAKEESK